jgi:hypothetical protein
MNKQQNCYYCDENYWKNCRPDTGYTVPGWYFYNENVVLIGPFLYESEAILESLRYFESLKQSEELKQNYNMKIEVMHGNGLRGYFIGYGLEGLCFTNELKSAKTFKTFQEVQKFFERVQVEELHLYSMTIIFADSVS